MNRLFRLTRVLSTAVPVVAVVMTASLYSGVVTAQDCPSGSCGGSVIDGNVVGGSVVNDSFTDDSLTDGGGFIGDTVDGVGGAYVGDLAPTPYCQRRGFGQPDLFYNYYTQGAANCTNAQLYLSPQPVPPNVGHTFYTYQPFYPHHMMYWHKDRYHNYYDGGRGMNRTRAVYYSPPIHTAVQNLYWNYFRLPR